MHLTYQLNWYVLVDSFSGWSEIVIVSYKNTSTIKQILSVIFSLDGIPDVFVPNNTPCFMMPICYLKIDSLPSKTPLYHLWSNGIADQIIQTIKIILLAWGGGIIFNLFIA